MWEPCKDINDKWIKVCWRKDNFKIILLGEKESESIKIANEIPNLKEACSKLNIDIADVIVQEWKELWIGVEYNSENKKEIKKIYFGEQEAQQKPNGLWTFTFRNYLGKSFIRIIFDNTEFKSPPIEVISEKTPINVESDPLFYPKFLKILLDELIKYLILLPFDLGSPTEFPTAEYPYPPSLIFILHTLAQNADTLIQALQTIWHNPYRKLKTEERWVLLNEATNVDVDTILMMFHHPEYLCKVYSGGFLKKLADKLNGYIPEKVFQRHVIETLDNPENRFIKHFIDTILFFCEELKRQNYWEKAKSHQSKLEELENYVRYLRVDSLFSDVGDMTIFPASSQVLLKRDGYRECLNIYRLLNLSRIPIFHELQDAIDNRRIDKLYEYWCFFELSKRLAEVIAKDNSKPRFEIKKTKEGRFEIVKAYLGNGYELVYNQTFEGYSGNFRPDFALVKSNKPDKPEIVFDAKFRFDLKPSENPKKEEEETLTNGNFENLVKGEDICKMHTYRDALKCRAAVIVYPGKEEEFYHESKEKKKIELKELLCSSICGVGVLGMKP